MKHILILLLITASCIGNHPDEPDEERLKALWSRDTNIIDTPDAQPLVIGDSKIIYTGEIELVAVDSETGEELWRGIIDNESALVNEKLLYDSHRKRILTNHKKDIKVWNSENGESIFTLTAEDGVQSFNLGRHTVLEDGYGIIGDTVDAYVINSDGSTRFSVQFAFASAGLAYSNQKIYMTMGKTITGALTKGKVLAFNAQTGDSLWGFNTDKGGFTMIAPIIENGILYASTIGNSATEIAVALDAETGEEIWKYESDYIFTRNSALGPKHYYVNTGGSLAALNKENGNLVWRVEWMGTDFNKPVYLEGYVYHIRDFELLVIDDESGKVVHREPVPDGGGFFWHVAASSDKVFAQTSRQLIAYQPWHLREN